MASNPIHLSPWKGDHLSRHQEAQFLSNFIWKRMEKPNEVAPGSESFVLAIHSDWGTGKSFLIKHWHESLQNELEEISFIFNAWESDFSNAPLLAFLGDFDNQITPHLKLSSQAKKAWGAALQEGKRILPKIGLLAGQVAAKHVLKMSLDEVKDFVKVEGDPNANEKTESSEPLRQLFTDEGGSLLAEHLQKQRAITAFKNQLRIAIEQLQAARKKTSPIIIFIDELDRCRPTFAIQLLEDIKHLFGTPGIAFVIGVNAEQLSHSIQAVYGINFDSSRYLKRFFDYEYRLPDPDRMAFANALTSSLSIPAEKIYSALNPAHYPAVDVVGHLLGTYSDAFGIDLRSMKKLATQLEACVASLGGSRIHIHYLIFLLVFRESSLAKFQDFLRLRQDGDLQRIWALLSNTGFGKLSFAAGFRRTSKGRSEISHSASDLIGTYLSLEFADSESEKWDWSSGNEDSIKLRITRDLYSEFPQLRNGSLLPSISRYAELVSRSGQFA